MTEVDEPKRDKTQVLRELQAMVNPVKEKEKDIALEGFINLYEAVSSGQYKIKNQDKTKDEGIYTNFVANFSDRLEDDEELIEIVSEVESALGIDR